MYVLRAYISKSIFEKILSEIKKAVKTFSISDKTFPKNGILLCVLGTHVSKIYRLLAQSHITFHIYVN